MDGGVHTTAVMIMTLGNGASGFTLRAVYEMIKTLTANQNPCTVTVTDVQHVTRPTWRKTNQGDSSLQYKKTPLV